MKVFQYLIPVAVEGPRFVHRPLSPQPPAFPPPAAAAKESPERPAAAGEGYTPCHDAHDAVPKARDGHNGRERVPAMAAARVGVPAVERVIQGTTH